MKRSLLGIAGGSGCGKSTLAIGLCERYPKTYTLVHLDDYFKRSKDAPKLQDDSPNWDHPDALRFDDLLTDIKALLGGWSIMVRTKSELYHPEYRPELRNRKPYRISPKRIIILEGYLALYDQRIVDLMASSLFLDMPIEQSLKRRSGNKGAAGKEYFENVLVPAHHKFVLPTRERADVVLDVSKRSPLEVQHFAEAEIKARLL